MFGIHLSSLQQTRVKNDGVEHPLPSAQNDRLSLVHGCCGLVGKQCDSANETAPEPGTQNHQSSMNLRQS